MKKNPALLVRLWQIIGNAGAVHCKTAHDRKIVRFMNRLAPVAGSIGILYLLILKLKFGILSAGLDLIQVAVCLVLMCIPGFNKRGLFFTSKIIFSVVPVVLILAICISVGRGDGGPNLFFASAALPLILFREKWLYVFFFLLSMAGFYCINYYLDHHQPLVEVPAEFLRISFMGNMGILFMLFFFMLHFQIGSANYYERELQHSKEMIEQKNKDITDSIHYAKRIQLSLHPTEKYIQKNMDRLLGRSPLQQDNT